MTKNKLFFLLRSFLLLLLIMVVIILMINSFSKSKPPVTNVMIPEFPTEYEDQRQWVVKWKDGYEQPAADEQFEVINVDPERRIALIQLVEEVEIMDWYMEWIQREDIEYIEPEHTMKLGSVITNDPNRPLQLYLKQIEAYAGWELVKENRDITIAILDTGVDLNHPDLKDNLVPGLNIIDPEKKPQDDHGHGTQLAGVIGAVGNNQEGVTGLLWSTKIMPVKVLPAEGEGSPFIVSQGIYQAVDHGVSIILMSLGGPVYSKTLQDAILYAEEQGVLVVAATGNEGSRVNYPAAFPTVLAVGAVNPLDEPVPYSNAGPEIQVVAPGTVYTTERNGEYRTATGTSLSAAQVAGLAGLVLKRYPDLTPAQLRNHIIYTADDVYVRGWDPKTGHGRINVWRAITTPPVTDIYEANNSLLTAAPFPIETMISAQLKNREDADWFKIDSPYRGVVTLQVDLEQRRKAGIEIVYFTEGERGQTFRYNVTESREIKIPVTRGTSHIKVRFHEDEKNVSPLGYKIVSSFNIYSDDQEPNNTKEQAFALSGNGDLLIGTFHRDNMQDWYYIDIPQKGELDIHVSVDTLRLDPVLYFERPDGSSIRVDDGNTSNGQEERLVTDVERGRYYIRLHHFYDNKVNGEYYLRVTYKPYFEDVNEPNNSAAEASRLFLLQIVEANISTLSDEDWFRLRVRDENQYITIRAYNLPSNVNLKLRLYNENEDLMTIRTQRGKEEEIRIGRKLKPGVYYIQVTADVAFPFQSYRLHTNQQEIIGGYRDIKRYWAQDSIVKMTELGLFEGVGDYLFHPAQPTSRAAVAQVLQRMYQFDSGTAQSFEDVESSHWAYQAIGQASAARIMSGYDDGTFAPSRSITRAEVATIFDRLTFKDRHNMFYFYRPSSYKDLDSTHWAYSSIMRLSRLGLMQGHNQFFRPNDPMTRAEFAKFVAEIVELKQNSS